MKKLFIFILASSQILAESFGSGLVFRVSDGDTAIIQVSPDEDMVKCRLYGIDAPEKAQPYGQDAKRFLSQMILGKNVHYRVLAKDMYGRSVCVITVADETGDLIANEHMVRMGMAWAYVQYLKKDKENLKKYLEFQTYAMKSKFGLWQDPNPEAPWVYRKKNRRRN